MFRLVGLLAVGGLCLVLPAMGQEPVVLTLAPRVLNPGWTGRQYTERFPTLAFPLRSPALEFPASRNLALLTRKPVQNWSPDTIEKMEAAFYCNDTPFIDQVRLPVAALWHGRVRLTGFESDVTTANFVLGLPGAGTLQSLNLMGSGHLAMRAPPSDQLAGMNVTISLNGRETTSFDNSALRGLQYLARSGRDFLQTILHRWASKAPASEMTYWDFRQKELLSCTPPAESYDSAILIRSGRSTTEVIHCGQINEQASPKDRARRQIGIWERPAAPAPSLLGDCQLCGRRDVRTGVYRQRESYEIRGKAEAIADRQIRESAASILRQPEIPKNLRIAEAWPFGNVVRACYK